MPVHIYGAGGGGGGTRDALSVHFTPTDTQSYTFTIDDVDFAQRFNAAKTTKHFDLFFEGDFVIAPTPNVYAVYHAGKGVVNGVAAQKMLAIRNTSAIEGDGSSMLWDGGFEISGNSASFTITFISEVVFCPNKKYRATWICEE